MSRLPDFDLKRVRSRGLARKWEDAHHAANMRDRRVAVVVSGSAWGPLLLVHPADIPAIAESLRDGESRRDSGSPPAA